MYRSNRAENKKLFISTGGFFLFDSYTLHEVMVSRLSRLADHCWRWSKSCIALLLSLCLLCASAHADDRRVYDLNIPAQALADSLNELSTQADILVLFPYDLVKNRKAGVVQGRYSVPIALEKMLAHSNLVGTLSKKGVVTVSTKKQVERNQQGAVTVKTQKSLLAQAIALITGAISSVAVADDSKILEEVVVMGVRHSLETAVAQKREADFVVDGIAAEDLGKFPDANVAESLQRVTGVAITRSRGIGQRLSVRGLGPEYNAVTINGRLMASDAAGREFNFDVLPSELISGADVIKSPTASMTEGSIGATVNIRTARPLDYDGFKAAASVKQQFADLGDNQSPEFSGVVSNTFMDGKAGALLSFAYKDEEYRSDAYHPAALENTYGADPQFDAIRDMWRPDSQRFSRREGERKRIGFGTALQFEPSDELSINVDGLFSRYEATETQAGIYVPIYDGFRANTYQVDGDSLTYAHPLGSVPNSENTILSVTSHGRTPFGPLDGNVIGQRVDAVKRIEPRFTDSYLLGFDVSYDFSDTFTVNADYSISSAKLDGDGNRFYNAVTGFNGGSSTYTWNAGAPPSLTFTNNQELDPSLFRTHYTDVRETTIEDDIDELKLDLDWLLEAGPLKSLQAGFAMSSRTKQQQVKRGSNPGANSGYISDIPDEIFYSPINESDFLSEEPGDYPRLLPDFNVPAYVAYLESLQEGDQYTPVLRPGMGFKVEEDTSAFFIQANFEGDLGDIPWRANIGVRHVETEVTSTGVTNIFRGYTPPFGNAAGNNTDPLLDIEAGAVTAIDNDYDDTLFSANIRFDLSDELVLRAAAAEVLTRPTLTDLSTSINFDRLLLASAGNPNLQPYRGKQYDMSLEWYPSESTSLSAAVFRKDLSSFVSSVTQNEDFIGADGKPVTFETTRPRNGNDATIDGWEFAALHSFDEGFLKGFGVQANLTLIDSEAEFDPNLSNTVFSVEGLSDQAQSLIVFYDRGRLHGRISYTKRSDYLSAAFGGFGQPELVEASENIDISLSYDITDNLTLTLEGNNLTNERLMMYQVNKTRVRDVEYNGSRYWLGLRATF
ncbi:MAG: TonB-dependent receptor [Cellvibrionaceae bacterium]|nr:TonB-dependent receptor [Cellvibrionaceae bacterium]